MTALNERDKSVEWTFSAPKAGDIIRVAVRFYHHYGIFVSEDEVIQFGARDNSGIDPKEIQVISTDIADFAAGNLVQTACLSHEEKKRRRSTKETVAYARSQLGRDGYDILHNNCEHFVNECVFGEPHSDFLENVRTALRERLK